MLVVLALIVAACGGDGDGGGTTADTTQVTGIDWELTTLLLDGTGVDLAGTTPTIRFDASGEAGGSNGCNSYGGSYSIAGGAITFGGMFQTEIGCQPDVAAVETAFMLAISRVDTFDTAAGRLTLSASDGSSEMVFAEPAPVIDNALQGSWVLDTIGDAVAVSSIVAGTDPTLEITDTEISGTTGCNSFFGALTWDADGSFVVTEMGWTEIGCERGIMQQEQAILETLSNAATYEIEGDRLLITTAEGDLFLRYTATG